MTDEQLLTEQLGNVLMARANLNAALKENMRAAKELRKQIAATRKAANDKKRQRYAFITENGETPFEVRREALADARAAFVHRMVNYGMTIADVTKALRLSRATVERLYARKVSQDDAVGGP